MAEVAEMRDTRPRDEEGSDKALGAAKSYTHDEEATKEPDPPLAVIYHEDDPLNWPKWWKIYIAGLVSLLAFVGQLSSALINPAYIDMADTLNITVPQASYCTTVYILFSGIFPIALVPFANVYGRRILYVIFTLIAAVANVGSAAAPTYGGVITGRVFNGIGSSVPLGIGAATICDLFPQGERGFYMGMYTLATTNGPHIAPIAGGFISQNLSWRWCFYIPAIIQGGLWVLVCFTMPETLFSREAASNLVKRSFVDKLLFHGKVLNRPIRLNDFGTSFRMAKYLAVVMPCCYFMTANTYGSALFAVTGAKITSSTWHFTTGQTGLFMGIPLTVGCMLGEASAGWVSDVIINTYARHHNGYRKPEARLFLMPLCFLLVIGTSLYGYCIQHQKPWIDAAVVMAISGLGTQVGTTMVYTYCTDSYKPQSGEVGVVINFFKSVYAFNIGFYALPLMADVGYATGFGICAGINGFFLVLLVFLIWKGEWIREKQGRPKEHEDL